MNITANVGFLGTLYSYTGSKHVKFIRKLRFNLAEFELYA